MTPLWIDEDRLASLPVDAADMVALLEATLRDVRRGDTLAAPKSAIDIDPARYLVSTLAVSARAGLIVCKAVLSNTARPSGQATVNGAIMVLDAESGALRAVLDAGTITAWRTAGLSALAARRLAAADSQTLSLIGAGVQARAHLAYFASLFPLQSVFVTARGEHNLARLRQACDALNLPMREVDADSCLARGDLVVSALSLDARDQAPFLDARSLRPGAVVCMPDRGIGWIPASLDRFGTILVDDLSQERSMQTPMVALDRVHGDLYDLLDSEALLSSRDATACHAFFSRGIAVADLALVQRVLETIGEGEDRDGIC